MTRSSPEISLPFHCRKARSWVAQSPPLRGLGSWETRVAMDVSFVETPRLLPEYSGGSRRWVALVLVFSSAFLSSNRLA